MGSKKCQEFATNYAYHLIAKTWLRGQYIAGQTNMVRSKWHVGGVAFFKTNSQNVTAHIYMGVNVSDTAHRLPCDLFDMRNILQDPPICTHPTSSRPSGISHEVLCSKSGSSLFDA
jgi:hypothetical protein